MRATSYWILIEGILAGLITLFISHTPLTILLVVVTWLFCFLLSQTPRLQCFFPATSHWPKTQNLPSLLLFMFISWMGFLGLTLVLTTRIAYWFGWLHVLFLQVWPLFIWVLLAGLQGLFILFKQHSGLLLTKAAWFNRRLADTALWLTVCTVTLLHWMILFFNLPLFDMLPGWFWKFIPKPFTPLTLIIIPLGLLVFGLAYAILNHKLPRRYALMILLLAGGILQIGFGCMDGQCVESLRLKYINTAHVSYAELAADRPDMFEALRNYEEHYRNEIYLGTKPPGVLGIYLLTQKISSIWMPVHSFDERLHSLTSLIAWVFPWLAMLVLWPLTALKRELDAASDDLLVPLLYLICPNVLLIPLFLDQVFYPLFFTLGLYLWWLTLKRRSWGMALLSGLYFYSALYFTFSMLPLLPLALAWLVLEAWSSNTWRQPLPWIKLLAAVSAGLLLGYWLLRLGLNYDIFLRYTHAMEGHRAIKSFEPGLTFTFEALFVNTLDIAAWTGFPVFILAVVASIQAAINLIRNKASQLDALLFAFAATYLALNLFGQTRGEVGRIWLFMLPLLALGAVRQIRQMFYGQPKWAYLLLAMQLISVFLTFQFQDFFA